MSVELAKLVVNANQLLYLYSVTFTAKQTVVTSYGSDGATGEVK